ncbi:V-set and immunoglobulin domain-containing protein 10-like isoform X1, partial [Tachysurus ichikawai]
MKVLYMCLLTHIYFIGQPKAVLSIKPAKHVCIGENITLRCDIDGGDTKWTYIWFKNKHRRSLNTEEGKGRLYKENTQQEFSIKSGKDRDSGNYTCKGQRQNSQSSEISDAVTLTVSGESVATTSG